MTIDDRWRAANGNSAAMFACRGQRSEVLRVLIDRCGAAAFSGKNFKKVARLVANQMPGIDTVRAQENSRAACVGNVSDVGCIRWARRSRHLADRDRQPSAENSSPPLQRSEYLHKRASCLSLGSSEHIAVHTLLKLFSCCPYSNGGRECAREE